jgi:hypothetical protein
MKITIIISCIIYIALYNSNLKGKRTESLSESMFLTNSTLLSKNDPAFTGPAPGYSVVPEYNLPPIPRDIGPPTADGHLDKKTFYKWFHHHSMTRAEI